MPIAQNPKPESAQPKKARPVAEFRNSNLRVTIWPNTSGDGILRHNVILTRSYLSNDKWSETPYLGALDLQRARKLLDRADDWIFNTASRERQVEGQAASA